MEIFRWKTTGENKLLIWFKSFRWKTICSELGLETAVEIAKILNEIFFESGLVDKVLTEFWNPWNAWWVQRWWWRSHIDQVAIIRVRRVSIELSFQIAISKHEQRLNRHSNTCTKYWWPLRRGKGPISV